MRGHGIMRTSTPSKTSAAGAAAGGGADIGIGDPIMGGAGAACCGAVCWAGAGACMYWICEGRDKAIIHVQVLQGEGIAVRPRLADDASVAYI